MLLNINLEKHHFDWFAEIIKIKNSLVDALKNRLCDSEKLNFTDFKIIITWRTIAWNKLHDKSIQYF